MEKVEHAFTPALGAALGAASTLPAASVASLSDQRLLGEQRGVAEVRRALDSYATAIAGEISHRSRPELGYSGLAARHGFSTPAALVQDQSGSTAREASVMIAAGTLGDAPWLTPVRAALGAGKISAAGARAIRVGLGEPNDVVDEQTLERAAAEALDQAVNDDERLRRAREARDALDNERVVDREKAIHQARALKRVKQTNGLSRYIITPDIEAAAIWDAIYDQLLSPRRGGPRFVDPEQQKWAEGVASDTRTPDQYLHDAFTELLHQAATASTKESKRVMGAAKPAVRVLVAGPSLESGDGMGHIEGQPVPISIASVERIACAEGVLPITFDKAGEILNLGHQRRLFSRAQRIALAARDGGCRCCGRPPSQTEAHHINPWKNGGKTDIADGILLCKFCHMLIHNGGWRIRRDKNGQFWMIPPANVDGAQTPRLMPSRSKALGDLLAASGQGG